MPSRHKLSKQTVRTRLQTGIDMTYAVAQMFQTKVDKGRFMYIVTDIVVERSCNRDPSILFIRLSRWEDSDSSSVGLVLALIAILRRYLILKLAPAVLPRNRDAPLMTTEPRKRPLSSCREPERLHSLYGSVRFRDFHTSHKY